jgi:hypothetical protein
MCHAQERTRERLSDAGMHESAINTVFRVAKYLECKVTGDTAVRLLVLPQRINAAWGERSNGDQVWGIYRNGTLATVMLRRSTQPETAEALRVDRVVILK